jgi:hypothetical protein
MKNFRWKSWSKVLGFKRDRIEPTETETESFAS